MNVQNSDSGFQSSSRFNRQRVEVIDRGRLEHKHSPSNNECHPTSYDKGE